MSGRQGFKYDGKSCVDYNLWVGYIETSPEDSSNIQTPYSYDFSMSPTIHRTRITNMKYDEPYSFNIEIICDNTVDATKEREIFKWLIDSPKFKKLEFFNLNGSESFFDGLHYNCVLSDPKRIIGDGGVVGWEVTAIADAPYAWTESQTHQFPITLNKEFTLTNESDESAYTYPKISITLKKVSGVDTCQILNETTGEKFIINNNVAETITIDEYGQISSSVGTNPYERCSGKIRLIPGDNHFKVGMQVSFISFTYPDARKVGYFA